MAQKVQIILTDDLSGDPIPEDGGETVVFSLDGKTYELDLTHDNAAKLRDSMGQYVKVARMANLGHTRRGGTRSRTDADRAKAQKIRQWAVMRGLMKPESRGRIAADIVAQYDQRTAAERVADEAKLRSMGQQATAETPAPTPDVKPTTKATASKDKAKASTAA